MPEIDVNGTRLTYVDEGRGEPLILVHGSVSDYRSWGAQVPVFSQHYRVTAYSRRFHYPHNDEGGRPPWSAALHADDLAALIGALGLGRAHLVGSSYGALTSLFCAVRHRDVVRSLVLAEPPMLTWLQNAPGGQDAFESFMSNSWRPATRAFEAGDIEGGVRSFVNGFSGAPVFDQIPEPVHSIQLANGQALKAETEADPLDYFSPMTCSDLSRVTAPALLLRGEKSPLMFGLVLDEIARCLPDVRRATIPGAGHSMASGNPTAFNAAVLAFLEGK